MKRKVLTSAILVLVGILLVVGTVHARSNSESNAWLELGIPLNGIVGWTHETYHVSFPVFSAGFWGPPLSSTCCGSNLYSLQGVFFGGRIHLTPPSENGFLYFNKGFTQFRQACPNDSSEEDSFSSSTNGVGALIPMGGNLSLDLRLDYHIISAEKSMLLFTGGIRF